MHCFVLWGCAWVRLVPHLELWDTCLHAGLALFGEGVDKFQQNRCKSAHGECECEMSAKSAVFCMVGMCLGSIGTTLGIVGCVHICWSGTFL